MAVSGVNDSSNPYAFLNPKSKSTDKKEKDAGSLALEDFMSLMTMQLKNQDPLKPMESGNFLGQIASFAQVTGISDLQKSFSGFAKSMQSDQALQGSALVGRSVLVPSSIGKLEAGKKLTGQIKVSSPVKDLSIKIYSKSGELVKTINMGAASGYTNFSWDGVNESGKRMGDGVYQFVASGTVKGKGVAFPTAVIAKVSSVLVGSKTGLTVNLGDLGSVSFKEVQEIL